MNVPEDVFPPTLFPAPPPKPAEHLFHGHRRKSFREEDIDELVELRARQRTFDGAYVRTALGNFGYALIILKVFTPEFAKIGLLYVILSSLLLIVSSVRAKRSDHDFADIYRPTTSIVRDDPASVLEPGPRIWGRPFRTSGYVVVLVGTFVSAIYVVLFVFLMNL